MLSVDVRRVSKKFLKGYLGAAYWFVQGLNAYKGVWECSGLVLCSKFSLLEKLLEANFRLWVICQEDIYHPQNSDIYHPQIRTFPTPKKKHLPGGQLPPPIFSFFFWLIFLGFFDLQLMEDIKDGKEEVLDEVVMEHIK